MSQSLPSDTLAGQRVVVTGSTSGIGFAIAKTLAGSGAQVVVHGGHSRERLAAAAQDVGTRTEAHLVDISSPEGCDQLVSEVLRGGPVDVWINNAGADVLTGVAAGLPFVDKLKSIWQVDVLATILLSRAIGQHMVDRGAGVILNIGWDQADWGMAGDSGQMFAASKGAVMAFTRSLAKSLAPSVRVNAIAPGWIRTEWGDSASSYWQQRAKGEALLDRWGQPDDVAQTALWLASPAAQFVNGQVIAVNGGFAGHFRSASDESADP